MANREQQAAFVAVLIPSGQATRLVRAAVMLYEYELILGNPRYGDTDRLLPGGSQQQPEEQQET